MIDQHGAQRLGLSARVLALRKKDILATVCQTPGRRKVEAGQPTDADIEQAVA
jgi:hypothetical protein